MANSNFRTLRADYIDGVNVSRSYIKNNSGSQGLTGWTLYNDAYLLTSTDTVGDAINIRNVSTGTTVAPYVGQPLYYTGTTPSGGLTLNTVYYVASTPSGAGTTASPWYFQISATRGGAAINLTSTAGDSNSRFLPYQPMGAIGNVVATSNTLAVSTVAPLNDVSNFLYTKAASITLGEGYRYDFTIARSDKYKVLQIDLDYQIASGTYATGDLSIYIIDTSTNTVIQPSAFQIENVGIEYSSSLTFQTSGGTNYRLCIHNSSISSAAYTLKSANYKISKQVLTVGQLRGPVGSIIYTGSAIASPGYLAAHGTAVSRTEYAKLFAVIGTTFGVGDGSTTFNLPDLRGIFARSAGSQVIGGQTFTGVLGTKTGDSTARPNTNFTTGTESNDHTHLQSNSSGGGTGPYPAHALVNNQANNSLATSGVSALHTHTVTGGGDAETAPANIGLNAYICFDAGDTVISSSADTRVVDLVAFNSSTQSVTANTTDIAATTSKDSHGGWNGTQYTIKVPGDYNFTVAGSDNATNTPIIDVYVNAVSYRRIAALLGGNYYSGSLLVPNLKAGDIVSFRSSITTTLGANFRVEGFMLQGPTQIAASEVIACRAYLSANQTGVNPNNSSVKINFNATTLDTHGGWNTSTYRYTCPAPGIYEVDAMAYTAAGNVLANIYIMQILKNGVIVQNGSPTTAIAATSVGPSAKWLGNCIEGDYFEFNFYGAGNNSASTLTLFGPTGTVNSNATIKRLGGV
jgi:microcystin-dependent protein